MDIIVKGLSKKYADKVVFDGFNCVFKENKTTVVMGKSGIGKTTLLNCIAKLIEFDGEIEGVESVSYVFQEDRLIEHLTVFDNLDFSLSGVAKKEDRKDLIIDILKDVELLDKISYFPSELSGGQKKRVAIARAFLSPSSVLLMDEPMNSLDYGLKSRMYEVFFKLRKKHAKTVIFVTHDIDDALAISDRIMILDNTKVVYSYDFSSLDSERDITSEECNLQRKIICEYLK